ncbi:MAG: LytR C-terminal domain-containing protein [Actinobacteria bacterium]|nr:LytR C-terminal domain-containing protein [Actinomycetota bacterium]
MAGRHAPKSPFSFYFSIARAGGGVLGAIVLVVVLTVVAFGGRSEKPPKPPVAVATSPRAIFHSPTPSPTLAVVPSPTPTVRAPSQVTVAVLNGTGRTGLAATTANKARKIGYKVKTVDNAATTNVSTIYYQPAFEAEAEAMHEQFPAFTQIKPATSTAPSNVMLTMVIGKDYP